MTTQPQFYNYLLDTLWQLYNCCALSFSHPKYNNTLIVCMVQLKSKLTHSHALNTHVFFNFCRVTLSKIICGMRVRLHVFCLCAIKFSLYALILFWQRMVVNLYAAHKKTDSHAFYCHAAHKVWFMCST